MLRDTVSNPLIPVISLLLDAAAVISTIPSYMSVLSAKGSSVRAMPGSGGNNSTSKSKVYTGTLRVSNHPGYASTTYGASRI